MAKYYYCGQLKNGCPWARAEYSGDLAALKGWLERLFSWARIDDEYDCFVWGFYE